MRYLQSKYSVFFQMKNYVSESIIRVNCEGNAEFILHRIFSELFLLEYLILYSVEFVVSTSY